MKKIITIMFSFILLFTAQNALAATWNGASNDCKSISIVNSTTNEGYGDPCWPASSVSADAGDTLNIRVYYHNTGTVTANNTTVTLNAPVGGASSTSKSFSGNINSDQGGLSLSSVVANLSSSQTITFNSVKWYTNNTSETLTSLPGGQSGAEILSGGLNLGSIAPGWATQGSLVVSFHVSNTTAPQLCQDTAANNYHVSYPCTYPAQLCQDTAANNYHVSYPCTYPAQLCQDTAANNYHVSYPCTYPATPVCSISSFTANPSSITSGSSASLSWSTSNCINAHISNIGIVSTVGSKTVYPTSTTSYTLSTYGSTGGNQNRTVTVNVNTPTPACSISSFTTNTSSITSGNYATLSWSTSNCTYASISNIGAVSKIGSRTVYPTSTTLYTLSAYGSTGGTQFKTVTINVQSVQPQLCQDISANNYHVSYPCTYPAQLCQDTAANNYHVSYPCTYVSTPSCTISSFTASDTSIEDGDSSTLNWNTNNCNNLSISGIGSISTDGSQKVYPSSDTTYVLNAYSVSGAVKTSSVKIYVDDNSNNNSSSCSIDSFTASDTSIESGDSSILKWRTTDCNDVSISEIGNVSDDDTETVSPHNTTTYTLRAYGDNGTKTKTLRVNVDNNNNYVEPIIIYNSNVVTTVATNISQTGAQVNGLITNSNYNNTNVHFEYGTSVNLGMRTASTSTSGNANFSAYLTNLSPNTIYYFQAVSDSSNVSRGAIEIFRTLGYITNTNTNTNTIIKEVIVQGTTVSGSTSPIMLQITNRYQAIGMGDIVEYTVYYKNISSSKLTKPMVQVFVPVGMTLINSSIGTYSADNRTLSAPIADLNPGDEGTIYLQARVDLMDSNLAQIVTTAVLVYTNPNGAQENAMAYVLNNPRFVNTNLLGASAFFGNMFGLGFIGWLLLIILILLLVLVARSLYNRRNVVTTKTQKTIIQ